MKKMILIFLTVQLFAAKGSSNLTSQIVSAFEEHLANVEKLFFDAAHNKDSRKRVLKFLSENIKVFKGGRKVVSLTTSGAEGCLPEDIHLINLWQTWMPWIRPDIDEGALESASESMKACYAQIEAEGDRGKLNSMLEYALALGAQDLHPKQPFSAELLAKLLKKEKIGPQVQPLFVKGVFETPSSFFVSENDCQDLLGFIYSPLQHLWLKHLATYSVMNQANVSSWQMPRVVWEMLLYRSVLHCGAEGYEAEKDLEQRIKVYLTDCGGLYNFESNSTTDKFRDEARVLSKTRDLIALLRFAQGFYQNVQPVPTQGVEHNRALWIRVVGWFSMLHRVTWRNNSLVGGLKWSQDDYWRVMQVLLSQRLLAGSEVVKPFAEIFASCESWISFNIYKDLFPVFVNKFGLEEKRAIRVESDLDFLAMSCVVVNQEKEGFFNMGMKCKAQLQEKEVKALFVEAALEEVMLACDALAEEYQDNKTLPSGARMVISGVWRHFHKARHLSDIQGMSSPRLVCALQMLLHAMGNRWDFDDFLSSAPLPKLAILEKTFSSQQWRDQYRAEFLAELKSYMSDFMKIDYSEIQQRADQALAKILPQILSNFDAQKEFPHCFERADLKGSVSKGVVKVAVHA